MMAPNIMIDMAMDGGWELEDEEPQIQMQFNTYPWKRRPAAPTPETTAAVETLTKVFLLCRFGLISSTPSFLIQHFVLFLTNISSFSDISL